MRSLEQFKNVKLSGIVLLPLALIFGILGLGSPVFFSSVSEDTLEDIGKEGKTIDQEIVRQLRQNNLGPAEMLTQASLVQRKDFGEAIESKKNSHPELAISGGGSILICLHSKITLVGWINTILKRWSL